MGQFLSTQIQASNTETQQEYMQRVINAFTSIDPRITCSTTSAAQYADTSGHATFDFDIDNKYVIRFYRRNVNSNNDNSFFISTIINGVQYDQSSAIRFVYASTQGSGLVVNGCFKVSIFKTDEDLIIWLGVHHDTPISDQLPSTYSSALIYDESDNYYSRGIPANNSPLNYSLYKCDDGTSNYNVVKCLGYAEAPGIISYVRENPISGNGLYLSNAKNLIGCSTVSLGSVLAFPSGKNYFAVHPNVIIEI